MSGNESFDRSHPSDASDPPDPANPSDPPDRPASAELSVEPGPAGALPEVPPLEGVGDARASGDGSPGGGPPIHPPPSAARDAAPAGGAEGGSPGDGPSGDGSADGPRRRAPRRRVWRVAWRPGWMGSGARGGGVHIWFLVRPRTVRREGEEADLVRARGRPCSGVPG